MKTKQVSIRQAKFIAHVLAQELMNYGEPIPNFDTRLPGRLESCLNTPFQYFNGKPLYRYIPDKAAVLFYLIIKNHPFTNGNKRLAVTITLVFFHLNNKWVKIPPSDLYDIACEVASSDTKDKEHQISALKYIFKTYMIKYK